MDARTQQPQEWRSSWKVLVASTLAMATGSSLHLTTAGLFITRFQSSFHWSRAQIGAGALVGLLGTASTPIAGMLADTFGVRSVAAVGFACLCAGFLLLAAMPGSLLYYYLALAFIGIFGAAATAIVLSRPVVTRFVSTRGSALGVALAGAALLMMGEVAATQGVILKSGWRIGFVFLALLPLAIGLPAVLSLSGDAGKADAPAAEQRSEVLRVLLAAAGDYRFWLLFVAMLTANFGIGGFLNHLPALLSDRHASGGTIALLVPLLSGSAVFGRFISGLAFDRVWPPAVACAELLLPVVGMIILANGASSTGVMAVAIFLIGWAQGAEATVLAYFTPRFFGLKAYSTIFGALAIAISVAVASGGFLFGLIFDMSGSYTIALVSSASGLVVAAACLLATSVGWSGLTVPAERPAA